MILRLAVRNLTRNKRRSAITILGIAFGLGLMIMTINLAYGSYQAMIRNAIEAGAGHVVVQAKGYQDSPEQELVVADSETILSTLEGNFPGSRGSHRIYLEGLITSPDNAQGGMVVGVDPAREAQFRDLTDRIAQGEWLAPDDIKGIVIGQALARTLGSEIGDKVVVMVQADGEVDSRLFRVRALWSDQIKAVERGFAAIHLDAAREILGTPGAANQVMLLLADPTLSAQAAIEAEALVNRDDLEVLSWRQALPDLDKMITLDRTATDVYLFIIASIVMLGVLNTVLMSVMERTREFGVVLALGVRPSRLTRQILVEGLVLGVVAMLCGLVVGALFTWPLMVYGIPIEELAGEAFESSDMPMDSTMYASFDFWRCLKYAVTAVVLTVLASTWPAFRAGKLKPVDAMRKP